MMGIGWSSWERFIRNLLRSDLFPRFDTLDNTQEQIMAALDDLKHSVASMGASISNELTAIANKLASAQSGTSDADIESVVSDINNLQARVDAETQSLSGQGSTQTPPTPTT